jgi:hypothetical protein
MKTKTESTGIQTPTTKKAVKLVKGTKKHTAPRPCTPLYLG